MQNIEKFPVFQFNIIYTISSNNEKTVEDVIKISTAVGLEKQRKNYNIFVSEGEKYLLLIKSIKRT